MNKPLFIASTCSIMAVSSMASSKDNPNIIIIYTDDMGMGDLSCYNGGWVQTPNIDKLALRGLKFNHYYTASPVSSPSRVALTTGMYPIEWGINTFLNSRKGNAECEQFDFLDSSAPSMAKSMKEVGYATAHIGKWHMGGGRDVDNAPSITKYGFDEYVTTYEGPDPDPLITASNWIWSEQDSIQRWHRTSYFVDKTLDFLSRHKSVPCFINLWPDDMHDPWIADAKDYSDRKSWVSKRNFVAVLNEYDKQIGRLLDGLDQLGISDNTLIIFTSDNGPLPTFDQVRTNARRGSKISLYEGGLNMPFLISWPAKIKPGEIDNKSVVNSLDLYPSLCAIVGAKQPLGFNYRGEDMSNALLGIATQKRKGDMMWDFGRSRFFHKPPHKHQQSPHLAIRRGDWKLLINSDHSSMELYNIRKDPNETTNLAAKYPIMVEELSKKVIQWYVESRRVILGSALQ